MRTLTSKATSDDNLPPSRRILPEEVGCEFYCVQNGLQVDIKHDVGRFFQLSFRVVLIKKDIFFLIYTGIGEYDVNLAISLESFVEQVVKRAPVGDIGLHKIQFTRFSTFGGNIGRWRIKIAVDNFGTVPLEQLVCGQPYTGRGA